MFLAVLTALSILWANVLAPEDEQPQEGVLIVEINNLANKEGEIRIALFDSGEGFPTKTKHAYRKTSLVETGKTVTIERLPPGKYAIAVLHDENLNGEMDFNFFGMPTEGFAFSNNPSVLRTPRFEECVFEIEPGQKELKLKMRYF